MSCNLTTRAQNFYLPIRRGLTHTSCNDGEGRSALTYEQYLASPSMKLDTLIQVLQHHLAKDNATPLRYAHRHEADGTETWVLEEDEETRGVSPAENLPRDRIVVFAYFAQNHQLIKNVSNAPSCLPDKTNIALGFAWCGHQSCLNFGKHELRSA